MSTEQPIGLGVFDTPARAQQRTRTRFMILALISGGTMINYLDRSVMGIAAPSISADLGLNAAMMGLIFSAFSWTYAAAQIPGGILIDRLGTKLTYWLALTLWSLFTGLQGLAQGFLSLLGMRFLVGVTEAPCFPTNSRVVATWFPQSERARATGIYTFAKYTGLAFLTPLLFWVLHAYGWRFLLMAVGLLGILYGLVWWRKYHEPHQSTSANQAELDYIAAGIVTPLTIGLIVTATGSFVWALVFVSSITALGALCYLFMVRDLRRLPDIPSVENGARQ